MHWLIPCVSIHLSLKFSSKSIRLCSLLVHRIIRLRCSLDFLLQRSDELSGAADCLLHCLLETHCSILACLKRIHEPLLLHEFLILASHFLNGNREPSHYFREPLNESPSCIRSLDSEHQPLPCRCSLIHISRESIAHDFCHFLSRASSIQQSSVQALHSIDSLDQC